MTIDPSGDFDDTSTINGTESVHHSIITTATVAPSMTELPMEPRADAEGQSLTEIEIDSDGNEIEKDIKTGPVVGDVTGGKPRAVRYVNGEKIVAR